MKKLFALVLTLALFVCAAALAEEATATYTIYNMTGEKVTELYAVNALTGEKGENYAGEGLENGASVVIVKTADADKTGKDYFVIDLTFVTESGRTADFATLHFETVPITLLSADAMTGATPIAYSVPQAQATYTIYNMTGEKVTELYAVNALTGEKGENYAGEGLENGASVVIDKTADFDKTGKDYFVIDLTFVTESGRTADFATLHFETVPITLLSADAMTGATPISYSAPQ